MGSRRKKTGERREALGEGLKGAGATGVRRQELEGKKAREREGQTLRVWLPFIGTGLPATTCDEPPLVERGATQEPLPRETQPTCLLKQTRTAPAASHARPTLRTHGQ